MDAMVLSTGIFHGSATDDEFYKYVESEFNKIIQPITYLSTSKKCIQILCHATIPYNSHKIVGNNITILPYHTRNTPCANEWLIDHTFPLTIERSFILYRIPYTVSCSIDFTPFILFTIPKFLKKNPPVFFGTPRMDEIHNITINFDINFDNKTSERCCSACGARIELITNNTCAQCIQISKNTVAISHHRQYDIFKYDCGFFYKTPPWGWYGHLFCQIGVDCTKTIIQIKNKYHHNITIIPFLVL